MPGESGKKLFVGPRFRRIRQQLGLSQTQLAEGLGISPSYVNLIERNQRPVSAQILLRLAETYDLDLRDLATADEDRFFAELNEIFSDPLFRQIELPKQELRDLAELCPGITHALQRLYAAYAEARRGETLVAAQMADRNAGGGHFEANPIERVRDLIEANRNYFAELEQQAEGLRDALDVPAEGLYAALAARLREKHSVQTRVMPVDVMRETLRRYDRHRRQLLISELVDGPGRTFQLAFQLGMAECLPQFEIIIGRAGALDDTSRRLYRMTLASYYAAAVMMPYGPFLAAAEALSYDINVLAQRFNTGFEQVCHRLTTLSRPNARGIPFFMLRVDNAGNVSKRFSSGTFPFSKFGGTCPLWNVTRPSTRRTAFSSRSSSCPTARAISPSRRWCAVRSRRIRCRSRASPSASAARSATPHVSSMRQAWTWRRPRAHRSASIAGCASAKTAPSAPSRRSPGR